MRPRMIMKKIIFLKSSTPTLLHKKIMKQKKDRNVIS